jgi:hypothetical protein
VKEGEMRHLFMKPPGEDWKNMGDAKDLIELSGFNMLPEQEKDIIVVLKERDQSMSGGQRMCEYEFRDVFRRYCQKCGQWVITDLKCPECGLTTAEVRRITDPDEVRKYITVRDEYKDMEDLLIKMIAESGALLEGHFLLGEDQN